MFLHRKFVSNMGVLELVNKIDAEKIERAEKKKSLPRNIEMAVIEFCSMINELDFNEKCYLQNKRIIIASPQIIDSIHNGPQIEGSYNLRIRSDSLEAVKRQLANRFIEFRDNHCRWKKRYRSMDFRIKSIYNLSFPTAEKIKRNKEVFWNWVE